MRYLRGAESRLPRWEGRLHAVRCFGRAKHQRPSVRGRNRLNARCHEGSYHSYRQNRDPDRQLRIHHWLHCLAPCPWDFLARLAFASDFSNAMRVPNPRQGSSACGRLNSLEKTRHKTGFCPLSASPAGGMASRAQTKLLVPNISVRCQERHGRERPSILIALWAMRSKRRLPLLAERDWKP